MIKQKVFESIAIHTNVSTPIISTYDNNEWYVQYSQSGSTISLYLVDCSDGKRDSNVVFIIDPTDIKS